jgi:asparagine synthase (glutamine-hydrolysing)
MCGIGGIFSSENFSLNKIKILENNLEHRGPDNQSHLIDETNNFALTNTRLTIIDLNKNSNQPMVSKNNGNVIVFNGEIYNYKKLREVLIQKKVKLQTFGDTETILEGYNLFGKKVLDYLNGMFAFAIWDNKEKKFFCARDRLGIKPFYYLKKNNTFIFSSEIKAITKIFPEEKIINNISLLKSVKYGSVHQPETIYKNINSLEPGHFIYINNDIEIKKFKYWELNEYLNQERNFNNEDSYYTEITKRIYSSINKGSIADVDIGSFLSGGVDSSIISKVSNLYSNHIRTFNISFDGNNEKEQAELISKSIGTKHLSKKFENDEISKNFENFITSMDQPSFDGLNTFLVSSEAAKYTKVSLSGIGADEMFFGYEIINKFINAKKTNSSLDFLFSRLYKFRPNRFFQNSFFNQLKIEDFLLNLRAISVEKPCEIFKKDYINKKDHQQMNEDILKYDNKSKNLHKRIFHFELKNYLVNTLLRDSDNYSMSNSLEIRPLFLDHELIEFVSMTLNYSKKINKEPKHELMKIYNQNFKIKQNKKIGFEIPLFKLINKNFKDDILERLSKKNDVFSESYKKNLERKIKNKKDLSEVKNFYIISKWLDSNNISI